MLNLENKTYVIMGIANKRSIAFGVAKVLDQLGAKLVFTYRKERSRKELEKLLEQLNQPEAHLYQIDVQSDEEVINGFEQIGKDVGNIDGVYHSIAFANMESSNLQTSPPSSHKLNFLQRLMLKVADDILQQ